MADPAKTFLEKKTSNMCFCSSQPRSKKKKGVHIIPVTDPAGKYHMIPIFRCYHDIIA
jgi:hypothetical protein